ncbi:YtxH domain-containing protein [Pedobacter ureilyticus]|jgi:hypothetical protein|uniref:YtxH domain-containing protein n=1 Tax=Pedobacter ureilyticus TaxID=1393051 RepID=A0ABW9J1D7_9SPHI|nr:YtxH domain-containing protein [Pedobacter helvus]
MGIIKTALIGAAVYGAVQYLTKKDALGRSRMDKIREKAPELLEKAKLAASDIKANRVPNI